MASTTRTRPTTRPSGSTAGVIPTRGPGADIDGRVAIDWGVYGVPETFVVDPQGRIAFKQIGPITPEILDTVILPLIARIREQNGRHAR